MTCHATLTLDLGDILRCSNVQTNNHCQNEKKTIHSECLCQPKPFDGNYPHSFNDLFLKVHWLANLYTSNQLNIETNDISQ